MKRADYGRVFACLLTLSGPVRAAQLPVVLQSEMGRKGSQKAFANLDDFANCVVKRGDADVSTYLAADFPPKHMDSGGMFLADKYDSCLRGTFLLSINPPYFRGALIEAKYHRLEADSGNESPTTLGHVNGAEATLPAALAECLVRSQPETAKRLLDTRPGSAEQTAAFVSFGADLFTCSNASGVSSAPPQLLRYQIAEGLYRKMTQATVGAKARVSQ
jgi:hypothetical protein